MSSSFRRNSRRGGSLRRNAETESHPKNGKAVALSDSHPPASSNQTGIHAVFERVGTKPWTGGLTLTSSGLRELDAILGGGQPLGTSILLEEDRWTQDLALALVRYWSAEAVTQEQSLSLVATLQDVPNLDDISQLDLVGNNMDHQQGMSRTGLLAFRHLLPRDLHLDKTTAKAKADAHTNREEEEPLHTSTKPSTVSILNEQNFGTIAEDEDDDDFDEEEANDNFDQSDEGLKNAWQYKMSVQKERLGATSTSPSPSSKNKNIPVTVKTYCHSYDLSGRMRDQHSRSWLDEKENDNISIVDCTPKNCNCSNLSNVNNRSSALDLYRTCIDHVHKRVTARPNTVVRMLILNAPVQWMAVALPLLLSHIRNHSLPVVLLMTVRPWLRPVNHIATFSSVQSCTHTSYNQSLVSLRRCSDAVFSFEGFGAMVQPPPSEFSDLAGILSIRKMALLAQSHFADSTTNRRPPANRYGMKRDRRKMHIRMLHLPPEDFSASGSSVGSGVRSGAGRRNGDTSENNNSGGSSGRTTALQPGMGCASNRPSTSSQSASLEF